jgi:hypothetical protein
MVGPVPGGSVLTQQHPQNVTNPLNLGYMQLSGTSFAAPVVSAAAAMLITQHPTWTPDQVKGALMVTATPEVNAGKALGVGDVNIARARLYNGTPPNPNAGVDQYIKTAADGTKTFDSATWQQAALSNKAWNAAAWSDAAWSDAAWASAAWASAAWADAAWASAAWASAAWSDAAWSDAAWSDAAWADSASADPAGETATASDDAQSAELADLGIVDASCDPTLQVCSPDLTGTTTP